MNEKNPNDNLEEQITRFLDVYKYLSPDSRVSFEIEIAKKANLMDERTKHLHYALIGAARDGLNVKDAIIRMKKIK